MKVALEMSERQALMRSYRIPPDIIYESMRGQREIFLRDGYSLVLKEKPSKGKTSPKVVGASFAHRLYDSKNWNLDFVTDPMSFWRLRALHHLTRLNFKPHFSPTESQADLVLN